jgi:hypothetical protein
MDNWKESMKKIIFISSSFCIMVIYLIGVFIFDNAHPFSKFTMYNSFADYSYVFYFTDDKNKMIKCTDLNITGTNMAHLYTTICEKNNFSHGHGMESDSVLQVVGKQMLEIIKISNKNKTHGNLTVKLNRLYFFYEGKKIQCKQQLMNEATLN